MQTYLIVLVVVVGMCGARPRASWGGKQNAGGGHYVVTHDRSLENGQWRTDYSLEYLPSYHTFPHTESATGHGATAYSATGHGATATGQHQYYQIGLDSSQEMFYAGQGHTTKGAPHTDRVKALSDMLNHGIVDLSNDSSYYYGVNPSAALTRTGTAHRQYYKWDDSLEHVYRYLAHQGQYQGHTQQQAGGAAHVARK